MPNFFDLLRKPELSQPPFSHNYVPTYNGTSFADGDVDTNKLRQNTEVDIEINMKFYFNNK